MIASPLSTALMAHFKTPTSPGVAATFVTMGILYFVFMMFGVCTIRIPRPGLQPRGYVASEARGAPAPTSVSVNAATRTPPSYSVPLPAR